MTSIVLINVINEVGDILFLYFLPFVEMFRLEDEVVCVCVCEMRERVAMLVDQL